MDLQSEHYPKFTDICANISLNLPEDSKWRWDDTFQTALVAFEKSDGDLVLFPLIKEFDHHWDFTSLGQASGLFFDFFQTAFGVIPGQRVFTSEDSAGRTLFAIWWPWGDDVNISLRVGLFVAADHDAARELIKNLLSGWFHL